MTRLRFLTASESHGPALVGILDGLPAGLELLAEHIERDLQRRKLGYGRGGRMAIEPEKPRILAGYEFTPAFAAFGGWGLAVGYQDNFAGSPKLQSDVTLGFQLTP